MLFQVSHANETDSESYVIKHIFLRASSLFHAHVYVTLFGFKLSPEFYDDNNFDDDPQAVPSTDPTQEDVDRMLNGYTLEYFEKSNEECSCGEHYWHSIKEMNTLQTPNDACLIQLANQNETDKSMSIFKVSIQTDYPCSVHWNDQMTMYRIEQNTTIYQFQAENTQTVIRHLFTHIQNYDGLAEFCQQTNRTSEQLCDTDWQTISSVGENSLRQCVDVSHDCHHGRKTRLVCEQISQPIPVFNSNM